MSCKSADDTNIIYAKTAQESADRCKAFIRTWRLKCRAVADSLEEGGEWLHEEFKRRIKTQTVRPSPESAAMLFWALLASARITPRKVDGWQTLAAKPTDAVIDLTAGAGNLNPPKDAPSRIPTSFDTVQGEKQT